MSKFKIAALSVALLSVAYLAAGQARAQNVNADPAAHVRDPAAGDASQTGPINAGADGDFRLQRLEPGIAILRVWDSEYLGTDFPVSAQGPGIAIPRAGADDDPAPATPGPSPL